MQWGDLSFQSDKVAAYVGGEKKITTNLRTVLPIRKVGQRKAQYASMNSRTMKLQSLSAIYGRDHSPEIFKIKKLSVGKKKHFLIDKLKIKSEEISSINPLIHS
jgi:hypothetical protein